MFRAGSRESIWLAEHPQALQDERHEDEKMTRRFRTTVVKARNRIRLGIAGRTIVHHSKVGNVYHCCVQKTASQWIRRLLSDPRTLRYSGLATYTYQAHLPGRFDPRKLTERYMDEPMPAGTIVTPLYMSYPCFAYLPKPDAYRVFFVARDPRDIIVSYYFSTRYSHVPTGSIEDHRKILNSMPVQEGLVYCVKRLQEGGLFEALDSWIGSEAVDPNVMLVRYENLVGENQVLTIQGLLSHLDIPMPEKVLHDLLGAHSFAKLSGGRRQGQEDQSSPFRKGVRGDWKNYFDQETMDFFVDATGGLYTRLGYS